MLFAINYYPNDLRENSITNDCEFNIIRFNYKKVLCNDYGLNKKFCNNYYLPYEFSVIKELGIKNNINYNIEPKIIVQEYLGYKIILANIYYTFLCSIEDNEPQLLVTIVPTLNNDKPLLEEFIILCFTISISVSIVLFIKFIFY